MRRRGHRAGPARVLTITEIVQQAPFIRSVLRGLGVPAVDMGDVVQDVMIGAWTSSQAGRYQPDPAREPTDAIQRWLFGLCWNHASHYRTRAFRRREVPVADPWGLVDEPHERPTHSDRLDVEALVRAIEGLPPWARDVVTLAALGHGLAEIAAELGIPLGTAASRLRRARELLARRVQRW